MVDDDDDLDLEGAPVAAWSVGEADGPVAAVSPGSTAAISNFSSSRGIAKIGPMPISSGSDPATAMQQATRLTLAGRQTENGSTRLDLPAPSARRLPWCEAR